MPPKRHKLTNIVIKELSSVDRPANQGALAVLRKRAVTLFSDMLGVSKADEAPEETDEPEVVEDTTKLDTLYEMTNMLASSLETIVADGVVDKSELVQETLAQFSEALHKAMDMQMMDKKCPACEKKGSMCDACKAKMAKSDDTPVEKSDEVLKAEEERDAAIAKLAELSKSAEERDRLALAKSMAGDSGVSVEPLAKALSQLDDEGRTLVSGLLAKHNAILKDSLLFKSMGSDSGAPAAPAELLEKAATALMTEDTTLTKAQAVTKAMEQNPKLYDATLRSAQTR